MFDDMVEKLDNYMEKQEKEYPKILKIDRLDTGVYIYYNKKDSYIHCQGPFPNHQDAIKWYRENIEKDTSIKKTNEAPDKKYYWWYDALQNKYEVYEKSDTCDSKLLIQLNSQNDAEKYCYLCNTYGYGKFTWIKDNKVENSNLGVSTLTPFGIEKTLQERGKTHGRFEENAYISQILKEVFRNESKIPWDELPPVVREGLDMFAAKICRILSGGYKHKDNWHDVQGYAALVETWLEEQEPEF